MEQKFIDLWFKNKSRLKEELMNYDDIEYCDYHELLEMTIKHIINNSETNYYEKFLNEDKIRKIDDGDYQGTLIFIIPKATYQPTEDEYYVTFVDYGSCSYCDTLQAIQYGNTYENKEAQIDDFMTLCLHMLERMKKLFEEEE